MLHSLSKFDRLIAGALDILCVVSSLLVVGLLVVLVVLRFFGGWNFISGHELSVLAATFLYMGGAVVASRRGGQLSVDFLAQTLNSDRARAIHRIVIAALTVIVSAFFLLWAYKMFAWGIQRPQSTPILRIPLWIPQLSILIGAVGCLSYALRDLYAGFADLRT